MKIRKILFSLLSTVVCVSASYASNPLPQLYLGAQGGYADTNFSLSTMIATTGETLTSASIKNHVFAARGYAGYLWNEYVATEAGYLRVRSTRYTNINYGTVPDGDISEYAVDARLKIFLPMAAYIHLTPYLQGGAAYLNATSHGGITRNGANDFGYSVNPEFGAGIGYNFTPYLNGDISWTTIAKRNSQVPAIYLILLGITYHFSLSDTKTGAPNYGDINNEDP